ncbi:hypothetical protein [Antarctobacter heliothermus]|uniref:Uncharacterized protein n=1 Tax=Antarctobacter heliothermus TaxID=74033 RepID=A0A239JYT7_9RHOB|nr:hypothetical protein [Antarctobacter heliothermus]SNT10628.1 hypothetical protein SAMN04488078_10588 [Antarctobacter heliothermus]
MDLNAKTDTKESGKKLPVSGNDFPSPLLPNAENRPPVLRLSHSPPESAEKENLL